MDTNRGRWLEDVSTKANSFPHLNKLKGKAHLFYFFVSDKM